MEKRECSKCPAWVEKCAHYDDKNLILHKTSSNLPIYYVCTPTDEELLLGEVNHRVRRAAIDRETAEAEFAQRELELLGVTLD